MNPFYGRDAPIKWVQTCPSCTKPCFFRKCVPLLCETILCREKCALLHETILLGEMCATLGRNQTLGGSVACEPILWEGCSHKMGSNVPLLHETRLFQEVCAPLMRNHTFSRKVCPSCTKPYFFGKCVPLFDETTLLGGSVTFEPILWEGCSHKMGSNVDI